MGRDAEPGLEFEDWYRSEHPRLLGSFAWITGDLDVAREVVDEACARALERWGRVGRMASPGGWTHQVALNVLRRRERRAALEVRLLHRHPAPPAAMPGPAGEAWDLVRALSPRERTAVALRYVADLTEADIASAMGVTRSTVSTLLARAHQKLAVELADEPAEVE